MGRRQDEHIAEIMQLAPPPNPGIVYFFEEKTLKKLNNFELNALRRILENYYVPRIKPVEEFSAGFKCPVCRTRFSIKAEES
jgi:hypothetical protein